MAGELSPALGLIPCPAALAGQPPPLCCLPPSQPRAGGCLLAPLPLAPPAPAGTHPPCAGQGAKENGRDAWGRGG